ncbi:hypothetical protein TNCV_615161 [Trichonephila clavipes]|nr:hypothetical protein TNCV_615161 [Trichonephila clavipes]
MPPPTGSARSLTKRWVKRWVAQWLEHRTPDRKAWVRCSMSPNTLRVHTDSLAEIVEVEIEVVSPSIVPSGSFTELKSHCHLYGAQGQRQAYLLPMPR